MTLLIGVNLGAFALIASDKREIACVDGEIVYSSDDADKIVSTKAGIIAACGAVDLLSPVKSRLAGMDVSNSDEILEVITSERQRFKTAEAGTPWASYALSTTSWLLCYGTVDENDEPIVRLALYHPYLNESLFSIIEQTFPIYPGGTSESQAIEWSEAIRARMASLDHSAGTKSVLDQAISHFGWLVDQVAQVSPSVSRVFDVGIMTFNGVRAIAREVEPGGTYTFQDL
ncbi:hypothetical protein [Pseudomonas sp. R2-60-08W]|uniref:hypothetical protein n=1 Tax=Pseudomonas sp. R2-60-08W TaxID=1173280 RepID=UPI000F56285F|nr:hypothetical protein [Pseudomonas sp. R2-60-08W]AZF28169.1 hypothetical protein C4J90_4019 [Pseudomonas sp. R2-60-08W]